jgi:4-amino-4-deoxy-L-arabinose transferase-like glycosyltransferase
MKFWQFDPLRKEPLLTLLFLILIILVAFCLRVYGNSETPPGFYTDEASNTYNAYSILKTGKDEHGVVYPLLFRAFGEYKNPIYIYSLVPLIALGGLNIQTARIGAAFWGVIAVFSLFFLAKAMSKNNFYSLVSSFILTLMPWHLHYSRIAFEAISFPALLTISLFFFQKWLSSRKDLFGLIFALTLGLTFYTYTTARFWVPAIILLLLFLFRKQFVKMKKKTILFFGLTILSIILPVFFWEKLYPGSLTFSFRCIAIWNGAENLKEVFLRFGNTFLGHWSPKFLFYSGDVNIRHSSQLSSELLISWSIPFLIGLLLVMKHLIKEKIWQFNFILIFTFPLAASLTRTSPIATRTLQATPFFALVIALAIYQGIKSFSKNNLMTISMVVFTILTLTEFSFYYYYLFKAYPKISWQPWHGFDGSLPQTILWANQKRVKKNYILYLSDRIEQAYIQGLFFTQTDPKSWQDFHQAPFKIISESEAIPAKGIIILTKNSCLERKDLVVLKEFGKNQEDFDYCVVQRKNQYPL